MRSLPPSVASLVTLYEEITEAGDVTFEWPAVPPGTQATFELTQAPAESTATASLSGVLDGADLPGAYVLERTCSLMGHAVRKDVAVALYDGGSSDPLSWEAPSTTTVVADETSAAVVWPTPTGGTGPYVYSLPGVVYDSAGAGTTISVSTSGAAPGTTTVTDLVNGQVVVLSRTATDVNGGVVVCQAVISVAAGAASLTFASSPSGQALPYDSTSATIGTWGAVSGGTGPYTYAVTEVSGNGTLITGEDLGPWAVAGLTSATTNAYLMTVTDSVGAKGYSIVTISVAAPEMLGLYEEVDRIDFRDADWEEFSTTSIASSTSAWYATLMAADGTTPRAYVYNTSTHARTLSLTPSGEGLELSNGTVSVQPTIGVWPAGWTALMGGSRRDAWMIEAVISGEEPAGSTAFVHMQGISCGTVGSMAASPGTGHRVTESSANIIQRAFCYISGFTFTNVRTTPFSGVPRTYRASCQVTIADSRRHDIYITPDATDFCTPESGSRVRSQATSTAMTAVGVDSVSDGFTWFASGLRERLKWWMYHDGANSGPAGSKIRLEALRLLRMPQGSR